MNVLTQTWRQLVRRRLWPLALLLVAALVAVPVVLAKPATTPAAPAGVSAAAPVATPAQSYVQLISDDATAQTKRRRVLGASKDPFEPAPLPKAKKAKKKQHAAEAAATPTSTSTSTSTATATSAPESGGGGTVTTAQAEPTATAAPKKHTVPANSIDVRFGLVSGALAKSTLTPLKTLPNASAPLAVFTGFDKRGKAAVFMLTGTVTAEGDGACDPDPQSCETLELHKGQTEFLTFAGTAHDGQYELDLNDLDAGKSASATVAKATATATATATAAVAP